MLSIQERISGSFIAIPTYDGKVHFSVTGSIVRSNQHGIIPPWMVAQLSLQTHTFNMLWTTAINGGHKYFAMHHNDIEPDKHWLETMHNAMADTGADVISAISPIKNFEGFTSTGFETDDPWKIDRLKISDVEAWPSDHFTDPKLVVNTGLMLVNLQKPWVREIAFQFKNAVLKTENGLRPVAMPEDWQFSKDAKALGAKVWATRSVRLLHHGQATFPSFMVNKQGTRLDRESI